ncbi:MAG: class I SAM-dependent methyltransferase [Phycisphaerales bacterium]|nr:class I SAM-dependent methyltransferase [Phycisphaerales bacterium]
MKSFLKRLAARAMRPGLTPIDDRLARIECHLQPNAINGIWRGGMEGAALDATGKVLPDATRKYREELSYWCQAVRNPRSVGLEVPSFQEAFGSWQRARLEELGTFLGLEDFDAVEDWCRARSAIEIGPGPFPSISVVSWKRGVAIDPLADGYASEHLLPTNAKIDEVTFIAAPGENIPLPSGFADIVIIENCLDHVDDPQAVVTEICRLLAPNGLLWILVDLMDYSDEMHPNPFSEDRLRGLLSASGFDVVRDRVSTDHKSHPHAYGEYRGLLRRTVGSVEPKPVAQAATVA